MVDASGQKHTLIELAWWDDALRLSITLPRSHVWMNGKVQPQKRVTKLTDWDLCTPDLRRVYGSYRYAGRANSGSGHGEDVTFLWDPPLTGEDEAAPGAFVQQLVDVESDNELYDWPNVMLDGKIILDRRFAAAGVSNPQPVQRGRWVRSRTLPTKTITQIWASRQEPADSLLKANVPDPTEISGDYFGLPINIPPCLHPLVRLTSENSDDAEIDNITPTVDIRGTGRTLIYPATRHSRWKSHTSMVKVVKDGGFYLRTVTLRVAPTMPTPTYAT